MLTRESSTELAMVETFQAKYVSLHVRVSNAAARHLYEDTLGFKNEKTEDKYYADGEDAFCMCLDLDRLRSQVGDEAAGNADDKADGAADKQRPNGGEHVDEGDAVGDVGHDPGPGPRRVKVAVGRGLGVGDLVEKDERRQ